MNTVTKKVVVFLCMAILFSFVGSKKAYAIKFDLIAPNPPSGGFKQGDVIKFTINVNTQAESVNSTEIGVSYKSSDLEYQSVEPGNTFGSVTGQLSSGQGLIIKGGSSGGYNGSGVYAYVNFKIVATTSGSTQLCTLFTPSSSNPTYPPGVPSPTNVPNATTAPGSPSRAPTALPRTGNNMVSFGLLGIVLVTIPAFYTLFTK